MTVKVMLLYPINGRTPYKANEKRDEMIKINETIRPGCTFEYTDPISIMQDYPYLFEITYDESSNTFELPSDDEMILYISYLLGELNSCNYVLMCKDWPGHQECDVMLKLCKEFDISCAGIDSGNHVIFYT